MKVPDLKYEILDKIISVEDEGLLKKINALIEDIDLEERRIKVSDAKRQMLLSSEQDIINGNLILNEEVNEDEDQWLKEWFELRQPDVKHYNIRLLQPF